jgi:hypothetical protein
MALNTAHAKVGSALAIDQLAFVDAVLNYHVPGRGRPRTFTYDPPAGEPRTTVVLARAPFRSTTCGRSPRQFRWTMKASS